MLHTQSSFFVEGLSSSNRYVEKPGDILRQLINLREIVASPGSPHGAAKFKKVLLQID